MLTSLQSIYRHRRRALVTASCVLASYYALDYFESSGFVTVATRTLWIAVIVATALAQSDRRPRLSDHLARLTGLVSGIASTVIVAGLGGTHGVHFGFLLGAPFCVLACIPDLLSSAALAGIASTVGGVVLLARERQPTSAIVEWVALSVAVGGLASWATRFYVRMIQGRMADERERTKALEGLRAAEERFHAAFSSLNLGAVIVGMDGTILEGNSAFVDMLGRGELKGGSYFDLLVPEDVEASQAIRSGLAKGSMAPRVERRYLKGNGEVMLATVHASPIHDSSGAVQAAVVTIEDITERVHLREQLASSEALFRDLSERAIVGVYLIQDGVVRYSNPKMAEMFGYSPGEMEGIRQVDLIYPEDRAMVAENVRKRMSFEIDTSQYRFRGLKKNGEKAYFEVFGTRTTYRSRLAILGMILDITEKMRLENDVLRVHKLESLGVLAGGIAHDFNNLLAAILGDISLAREHAKGDALLDEVLSEASSATMRARDLTRQLLTFSRGGEPVRKRFPLGPLLESSASFASRGSPVRCEFELPSDLWPVNADEGQIGQVVHNLVLNSVQAMPSGGVVRVTATNVAAFPLVSARTPSGRGVRVTVSDTGPGIPADLVHKVFDPYFTTKSTGSGLGLASAHSIVVRHGGHIGIDASEGRGATVYFYLPAAEDTDNLASHSQNSLLKGRGRVIVMDDDELVRKSATRMLRQLGFQVLASRDGSELLSMCEQARNEGRPVLAAILDLTIPGGLGGREVISTLKEREPHLKAIVSSGYCSDPVMSDYQRYGFSGVVPKPYSLQDLSEILQRVLAAPADQDPSLAHADSSC